MRKACLLLVFLIVSMGIVFPPSFFAATNQKKKTRQAIPPITSPRIDTSARLALVIGNSAYESSPLKNPVNDASDIAAALQELGFTVILKKNADLRTLEESLEEFGSGLKRGGVGLFFYAGHGVQVQNTNYLIPIGASVKKESDVKYVALNAEKVLDEMEYANNGLNIVILDACRDNPFTRQFRSASRGLASIRNAPAGTFIAYSTGEGKVADDGRGRNSPFTAALLKAIKQPGLTIDQVFNEVRDKIRKSIGKEQIPWTQSSLNINFSFNPQLAGLTIQGREEEDKFSLDDLKKKDTEDRAVWNTKQKNMKNAFGKAEEFEKTKTTPDKKITAWQRFLDTYQEKNPYSDEDTRLREKAGERISHWGGEKKALEEAWAKLEAKKKEAEEKRKQAEEEKRLEAERLKEEKKQKQIEAKQKQEEERQRLEEEKQQKEGMKAKKGDKAAWDAELKKMKAAFKKAEEYEKKKVDPNLKIEAWMGFLDTYDVKNPYTDEDRQIRTKAGERIDHWWNEKNTLEEKKGKKDESTVSKEKPAPPLWTPKPPPPPPPQEPTPPSTYTDPVISIEMVLVKGGCYQMGDTFGEGWDFEKPIHEVCVDDFYLGKYEVTQRQWKAIMGNNPSDFNSGDNYPVENVTWYDAQEFIRKLNQRAGKRYRLPTEAEWEYAARSGGKKEKWAGTSNDSELGAYAWYNGNSGGRTHPVGEKRPNGLGLHDMTGNVWEWVEDTFDPNAYQQHSRNNPIYTGSSAGRVIRGGAWYNSPRYVRAANRISGTPDRRSSDLGFRLAGQK